MFVLGQGLNLFSTATFVKGISLHLKDLRKRHSTVLKQHSLKFNGYLHRKKFDFNKKH
jgi:hypothetical protein